MLISSPTLALLMRPLFPTPRKLTLPLKAVLGWVKELKNAAKMLASEQFFALLIFVSR